LPAFFFSMDPLPGMYLFLAFVECFYFLNFLRIGSSSESEP
jgi:hypothetical protein